MLILLIVDVYFSLSFCRFPPSESVPPHVPLLATFPIKNGSVSRGKNFLAKDPEDEALGCAFLSRLASSGFTNLVNMPLSSHQLNLVAVFLHRDKLKEESVLFGRCLCGQLMINGLAQRDPSYALGLFV